MPLERTVNTASSQVARRAASSSGRSWAQASRWRRSTGIRSCC